MTGRFERKAVLMFVLGSLLPLLLAAAAALTKLDSDLVNQTLDRHGELIERVVTTVQRQLRDRAKEVEALASRPGVRSLSGRPAREALEAFLEHHPAFAEVTVAGWDGALVATASRGGARSTALDPASRPELFDTITGALRARCTRYTLSTRAASDPVEVLFAGPIAPYVRAGEPRAVVVARLHLHALDIRELTDGWKLTGSTYLLVTHRDGRVLAFAGRNLARKVRRIRVEDPATAAAPPGARRTATGIASVLGRTDVVATSALPGLGLEIVVGRPYSELSGSIDELVAAAGFHVLAGGMLALVLGILLARSLVTPVLELTDGIHRVARGEVAHRLAEGGPDELGRAAQAFNHMTSELQKGRLLETAWAGLRSGKTREAEENC